MHDMTMENALYDRERFETIFQPLEDALAEEAENFNTHERREEHAGRQMAEVSQQFDLARDAAAERLESFGIDPGQTRFAALDVSTRTQEAAARAGAGNMGREQVENMGRALRGEAINVGRGYPSQIAQSQGTALQAGNQAVNSGIATTATGAQAMGNPAQYNANAVSAINGWWQGTNQMYSTQSANWRAQQSQGGGAGQALGLIGGMGARLIGGMFEQGGAVDDVREARGAIPLEGDGMGVPEQASPSRGAVPDDIPARLDAGEFVLPEDVVSWYGEKHMHQQIIKAREERDRMKQQSGAVPDIAMLPAPEQRQAIPAR